jgi:hypothetical protein
MYLHQPSPEQHSPRAYVLGPSAKDVLDVYLARAVVS